MARTPKILRDQYEIGEFLGRGSYGRVSLVRDKVALKNFVLKSVDLSACTVQTRRGAELEVRLLSTLRHPNIVRYKDSFETRDETLHIIMEYCEGGDLFSHIKQRDGRLYEERQIMHYFVQVCMALEYLHEHSILHRDLKTQNLFLTKNDVLKVGDFGIARILDSTQDMATTLVGTPYYMSPEIFANIPYNYKSDIWAVGCCLYELCTLKHAFNATDLTSLMYRVKEGKIPPIPVEYSAEISQILRKTLRMNPDRRPSAAKILRHPIIRWYIKSFLKATGMTVSTNNTQESTKEESLKLPSISTSVGTLTSLTNGFSLDFNANELTRNSHASASANGPLRKRKKPRSELFKQLSDGQKEIPHLEDEEFSEDLRKFYLGRDSNSRTKPRSKSAPHAQRTEEKAQSDSRRILSAAPDVEQEAEPKMIIKERNLKALKLEPEVEAVANAMNATLQLGIKLLSYDDDEEEHKDRKPNAAMVHDMPQKQRRVASLQRQCSIRLSKKVVEAAFALMEKYENEELEVNLKTLLRSDYDLCAPILVQLKMYEESSLSARQNASQGIATLSKRVSQV